MNLPVQASCRCDDLTYLPPLLPVLSMAKDSGSGSDILAGLAWRSARRADVGGTARCRAGVLAMAIKRLEAMPGAAQRLGCSRHQGDAAHDPDSSVCERLEYRIMSSI